MSPSILIKVMLGGAGLLTVFLIFRLSPTSSDTQETHASQRVKSTHIDSGKTEPALPRPVLLAPPAPRNTAKPETNQVERATSGTWTEHELISELRSLNFSQPELALELAREGKELFSQSESAAELNWFEARALVDLQRFEEAKDVGREMLDTYPESSFTADVRHHLFTHPFGESPRIR